MPPNFEIVKSVRQQKKDATIPKKEEKTSQRRQKTGNKDMEPTDLFVDTDDIKNINKTIINTKTKEQSGTECSFSIDNLIDKSVPELRVEDAAFPDENLRSGTESTLEQITAGSAKPLEEYAFQEEAAALPFDVPMPLFEQQLKPSSNQKPRRSVLSNFDPYYVPTPKKVDKQEKLPDSVVPAREAKLVTELNACKNGEQIFRKVTEESEKKIADNLSESQKLSEENESLKRHLENLQLAFSDVHQKYEKSKKIIDGYKSTADALRERLSASEDTVIKSGEKYESLKLQIEKSSQEMQVMREEYETKIHKLSVIIRRLEITNASLTNSLDEKTKECSALTALCYEMTGKV